MPPPSARASSSAWALAAGGAMGVMGLFLAGVLPGCGEAPSGGAPVVIERDERRALTSAEEIAQWTDELARRGSPWFAFPDPPGDGPLSTATFALGFESYLMEVRARQGRLTLGIRGVDRQVGGGGWLAFAEGSLASPLQGSRPFAGAVARISWSCLGTKLMSGNDGVARLTFTADGTALQALYLGYGEPEVWTKAYARQVLDGERPSETLRGQIPSTHALPPLAPTQRYARRVRVRGLEGRALPFALVQLKGLESTRVLADEHGVAEVTFFGRWAPRAQVFSAAAHGYANGEAVVFSDEWERPDPASEVLVELRRMPLEDHPEYRFRDPSPDADPDDTMACGACHKWHYDEWLGSRHARSASNGHVAYEHARMRREAPEAPDDCRGCHQPADVLERPGGGWTSRGVRAANSCDLCHKIQHVGDVRESGVLGALRVLRPDPKGQARPGGIHHVFGPLPDVTYAFMGAGWNPLFQSAHLCAGCHQGGGLWRSGALPKLDTFEEWRRYAVAAEAAAPGSARTCQDCHMPPASTRDVDGKAVDQAAWDGLHRHPGAVHEHRFEGSGAQFASQALRVDVDKRVEGARLEVTLGVTNTAAGHRVPTGTWSKHVVVGVWARVRERWLPQVTGDRAWLVSAPPPAEALAEGDWRNPGGLVLGLRKQDERSGALNQPELWFPWTAAEVVDERLEPGATRWATCVFELPAGASLTPADADVVVHVMHRRGELGLGPAHAPWTPTLYDEPAELLWARIVK